MQFHFPELSSLRGKTHQGVDDSLNGRIWMRKINFGGSWQNEYRFREITDEMRSDCHTLCDFFIHLNTEHKLIISLDQGYFYTNNLEDVSDLLDYPGVIFMNIKEVSQDIPADSILIRSAKHSLRTYFKSQFISSDEQKISLKEMLINQPDIRLSPGLSEWFDRYAHSKYLADNYFIDHNDTSILTMIGLICPIKIKHTLNIIRDK